MLLIDGWGVSSDGLGGLIHQLPGLFDGHPLKLIAVFGLLMRGGGHHRGTDLGGGGAFSEEEKMEGQVLPMSAELQ